MMEMNPETSNETLLWELAMLDPPEPALHGEAAVLVSDALLAAYREGTLAESRARHTEGLLAASPAARRRLLDLAGLAPAAPTPRLRRRVLAALPRGTRSRGALPARRWAVAASLAAAVVLASGYQLSHSRRAAPETRDLPAYEITASALAARRSAAAPSLTETAAVEAFPATPISFTATVAERPAPGVEYGLYLSRHDHLERLPAGPGASLGLEISPGVARFHARRAADLVGDLPGDYELLLAVGWRGELPPSRQLAAGLTAREALAAGGARRVYEIALRVLPPPSPEHPQPQGETP